eukprot:TRINITY_DN3598_c0_g1_i4.p1 TRINITY_DN3598_c0_g1~~TRINITY_DN3598_c0_g1_i4.p1  ORF type:complete len:223 (-),score=31.47 TRINITY_DN3598_c0_g1_i4:60-728(-)
MWFNKRVGIFHSVVNLAVIIAVVVLFGIDMVVWWQQMTDKSPCNEHDNMLKTFLSSEWITFSGIIAIFLQSVLFIRVILSPWFIRPENWRYDLSPIGIYLDSKTGRLQNTSASTILLLPATFPLVAKFLAFGNDGECLQSVIHSGLELLLALNWIALYLTIGLSLAFVFINFSLCLWKVLSRGNALRKRCKTITRTLILAWAIMLVVLGYLASVIYLSLIHI